MYKLTISPQARKELKKVKKNYQISIRLILREIKEDPTTGKPLTRDFTGKFSYRVGVYRIIYRVNKKDKIIYILSAGHRSTVYL